MKTWNRLFLFLTCIALAGIFSTSAFAQGEVYRYTDASFSGTFVDISSTGSFIAANDDATYAFTGPPFAFNYDSVSNAANTTMYIQTNGYTGWSSLNTNYNDGIGDFSDEPNAICPFCCDLVTGGQTYDDGPSGGMYYQVTGTTPNRVFIIEWDNFETYENEDFTSMEVKLYETSNVIEILYKDHDYYVAQPFDGNGGGTGLNGQASHSPNDYLRFGESEQLYTPSTDVRFTPPSVLPPQEFSLTPNPKVLNFGTAAAGVPVLLYATVKSVGAVGTSITINSTLLSGSSAYSVVSGPPNGTVVPQGSSVQYGIQFLPLSSGTLSGAFAVATTGRDSGTQVMNLTGVGAVPEVSYSSTSMFRGITTELTDTSGVQYLYVNSTGVGPLNVNSVTFYGLDARAYFITHMPAGAIPGGGVDSIGVRFVPDLEGLPDAHMVINTNAANIPSDTVSLYGVGILPHLAIDSAKSWPLPTTVNFDSVKLGTDSTIAVQLWNPGSDTIAIEQNFFESDDPDFSFVPLSGRDTLIAPGGTQNIQIVFTPVQQGTREATIRIRTDIPHTETNPVRDTSQFVINVVGVGVPIGKLEITGPSTNGNVFVGGTPGCVTDTFWNKGASSLTITTVEIPFVGSDFNAGWLNLQQPIVLAPNSFEIFTECASPNDTGLITGRLIAFATTSDGTPDSASLGLAVYGEELADTAIVTQAFLSGSCGLDTLEVAVQNTGNVADSFTASVPLNSNFTLLGSGTSPVEPAGGVDTFKVLFTPTSTGTATGTLNIVGGSGVTAIPLSANAGAATIAGDTTAPMTAVGVTSTPFTVTVNNTGTCPWTSGTTVTVDPQFSCSTGSTTIAAGSSAPFTFTYTPTSETPNTYAVTFPGASVSSSVNVNITTATDAVQPEASSNGFSLNQNYPNPFNETSSVEITLPVASLVHLSIIDVQGQVVETLMNQHYDAGSFEVTLDASQLASGTYYYQMTAGNVTLTRQMVILK